MNRMRRPFPDWSKVATAWLPFADAASADLPLARLLRLALFQVSVGMTIGLAPITGIPLPWMSYGRSALLTNFIALGIVESVANYRHRLKFSD